MRPSRLLFLSLLVALQGGCDSGTPPDLSDPQGQGDVSCTSYPAELDVLGDPNDSLAVTYRWTAGASTSADLSGTLSPTRSCDDGVERLVYAGTLTGVRTSPTDPDSPSPASLLATLTFETTDGAVTMTTDFTSPDAPASSAFDQSLAPFDRIGGAGNSVDASRSGLCWSGSLEASFSAGVGLQDVRGLCIMRGPGMSYFEDTVRLDVVGRS